MLYVSSCLDFSNHNSSCEDEDLGICSILSLELYICDAEKMQSYEAIIIAS